MEFSIDAILAQASNPVQALFTLWRLGGWIVFYPLIIWMMREIWLNWIAGMYYNHKKFVLLAIDVPRLNEQSMRAVEQIIATFHGVQFSPNFKEKWWIGKISDTFSLEIVSIDGYIQYFIRCEDYNVDLVKGAVFAQYPDAEIIEVEDYVTNMPQSYPDEKYDLYGTEFVLARSDVYPIKTYEFFEHPLTGIFADPIAAILELMSRIRPGEQVWLQLVLTPSDYSFKDKAAKEVDDLIGKKTPTSLGALDYAFEAPMKILEGVHNAVFSQQGYTEMAPPDEGNPLGNYMGMTSGEQIVIQEIQKKATRLPFEVKFRFVYIAPKEIMDAGRVAGSIYGSLKQFNTLDMNSITWGGHMTVDGPQYFFTKRRMDAIKNKLFLGYKYRSNWTGEDARIYSHVEIASVFHFPTITVKAPLVAKATAKKAEPPTDLPFDIPLPELTPVAPPEQKPEVESVPLPPPPPPPPPPSVQPPESPNQHNSGAPLPPFPPAAPTSVASSTPPSNQPAQPTKPPLYSMPGLPPGVHPVAHPHSPDTVPQQSAPPVIQPVEQTPSKGTPPTNLPFA